MWWLCYIAPPSTFLASSRFLARQECGGGKNPVAALHSATLHIFGTSSRFLARQECGGGKNVVAVLYSAALHIFGIIQIFGKARMWRWQESGGCAISPSSNFLAILGFHQIFDMPRIRGWLWVANICVTHPPHHRTSPTSSTRNGTPQGVR